MGIKGRLDNLEELRMKVVHIDNYINSLDVGELSDDEYNQVMYSVDSLEESVMSLCLSLKEVLK